MLILLFGAIVLFYFLSTTVRLTINNFLSVIKYMFKDSFFYFKHKKYNECKTGELVCFEGLFGRGKTLSCVYNIVTMKYKRYNNKTVWCPRRKKFVRQVVHIISNVDLCIPYERFISLEQIYKCAETIGAYDQENDTLTVTFVLGDEFSVQLNSREFKKNINPLFLNTLLTCRHYHLSIYYTSQRFGQVDALLRQVTAYVVDCDKVWRFQFHKYYNAWDLENTSNLQMIKPLKRTGFFVTDKIYNAYDTYACVQNLKKSFEDGDMMSDREILDLQCNSGVSLDNVTHASKKLKKFRKK